MPPSLAGSAPSPRRGRRLDLAVGIGLGLIVGVAVVAVFVFLGSEGTIDAPRISGVDTGQPELSPHANPAHAPNPTAPVARPLPTVRVVGGAPPASGPVHLRFERGERVRFRVLTDAPVAIEIPGYGIEETLESGQILSFEATRTGQFPVVAAASEIGLASLEVRK